MANRKISQFTPETDITKIEGLAGYDNNITNVQISGNQLVTSLEENLYKPFGAEQTVLTIQNGSPAWVLPTSGNSLTPTGKDQQGNNVIGSIATELNFDTSGFYVAKAGQPIGSIFKVYAKPQNVAVTNPQGGTYSVNEFEFETGTATEPGPFSLDYNTGSGVLQVSVEDEYFASLNSVGVSGFDIPGNFVNGDAKNITFDNNDFYLIGPSSPPTDNYTASLKFTSAIQLDNSSTLSVNASTTAAAIRTLIGAGTSDFDGSYSSLSGTPTIGDGELTITVDGTAKTFKANQTGNETVTITTGGALPIENAGVQITAAVDKINFTGNGVTASVAVGTSDVTVNVPGGGGPGGSSAFATITTDSTTGDAEWDYANDGPNIEWKPEFPNASFWNLLKMKNNVMPSNGDHGYLILDPSLTSVFQLPSNSLILNGDVLPGGTNTITYEWVYDGTNFHWEKQPNQITPIYAPFNPFPANNLIGVWDPDTLNPVNMQYGNPYDEDVIPNDPGSSTDISVNYAVGNGASWINSYSSGSLITNLVAALNPTDASDDDYKPSFVVNYMGGLKLAEYDESTDPEIQIPNPTEVDDTTNKETFYFHEFESDGNPGTYTTATEDVLTVVGGINTSERSRFTITSDGTDITSIEVTNTGKGYALGDLIQINMDDSNLGTGYIYILVNDKNMLGGQGAGSKKATAVQVGYANDTDLSTSSGSQFNHPGFGSSTYNSEYRFTNSAISSSQSLQLTVVMWIAGQYPQGSSGGSFNGLFDFVANPNPTGNDYAQSIYLDGTTGYFYDYSNNTKPFDEVSKLGDFSSGSGSAVNFNNQWTFVAFNLFGFATGTNVANFMSIYMANQASVDNAGNANWDYGAGSNNSVGVDANGFMSQTIDDLSFNEITWNRFSLGGNFYPNGNVQGEEACRFKIGKVALYNGLLPITPGNNAILDMFNATKGYYGIS